MLPRLSLLLLFCTACPESSVIIDSGSRNDASAVDAFVSDVSEPDRDTGPDADVGPTTDAGRLDLGTGDLGADDAGQPDPDAGPDTGLAICSSEALCEGACEGDTCGEDWFCNADVGCTDDIASYCGCDGETFFGSSSCPPQPFAHRGECRADGANCDVRLVTCRREPPDCAAGHVPQVEDRCYAVVECVPIEECGCRTSEQCSDPDLYVCRSDTRRCGPNL